MSSKGVAYVDVVPFRNKSGGWVLQEVTTYYEKVPTRAGSRNRTTKKVWAPTKQKNGRGRIFETFEEAVQFFIDSPDRKQEPFSYGSLTNNMVWRHER